MTRWWGRSLRVLLGAALLAGSVTLATPLPAGADSATGTGTATVTLTSSQNPSAYGEPLVLTATVIPTAEGSVPDGSVTFSDSGVELGTVTLDSSGQAAFADSDLGAGTGPLQAEYSGSATYAAASSGPLAQVITVQGSSTSLFAAPDRAGYGDTVVAVATVLPAAGSGTPTGTVSLMNGSQRVATSPVSDGVAAFAVTTLAAGNDSLTAAYAGDGNFASSTSPPLAEQVEPAATSTTLSVSPSPARAGSAVTLTATVTSAAAVPGGEVSFSASGTALGTAGLSDGRATFAATFDQPGSQELVAAYAGDGNFQSSRSPAVRLGVRPAPACQGDGDDDADDTGCCATAAGGGDAGEVCNPGPSPSAAVADAALADSIAHAPQVTVSAFPSSVDQGQTITLTSLILGSSGAVAPSGTVSWVQGSRLLGSAATVAIGSTGDAVASLRILLPAGEYGSVAAQYAPDRAASGSYSKAKSSTAAAVKVARVSAATTLTVASSENPLPAGGSAIFTATVNHPLSSLAATGTVTFSLDGSEKATAPIDGLGQASLEVAALSPGSHTVTAAYGGDDKFAPAEGSARETVLVRPPQPTPTPTVTPRPTGTPGPGGSGSPPGTTPSAGPGPTAPPSPTTVRSVTTTPGPSARGGSSGPAPSRSSGGSGPTKPGASAAVPVGAAPPVGLISLVAGIQLGNAPQIIVFLVIANALLALAILLASRRGRRLTRRSLEWDDATGAGDEAD